MRNRSWWLGEHRSIGRVTLCCWLAVASAAWIASPKAMRAQSVSGDLVGTVFDPASAGIPQAIITATNIATNMKSTTITNASGEYRFSNLPAGLYNVAAAKAEFTGVVLKNVAVQLNQVATANLTMQLGAVTVTLDVSDSATVINTSTAQIASAFGSRQSEDLPTTSSGFGALNMAMLSAGVASAGGVGVGAGVGPSVGGQRVRSNNFTVEGIDNNEKSITGPSAGIPNDAIQEFSLLQNQFTAEYGHSMGGQFNTILKSGTNTFHGMFYEYFQNRNLNALDQHLAVQGVDSRPRFDQNRLGANIGGPISKDKWFYFGDVEYSPVGQASTAAGEVLTPTAQGYSALSRIPAVNKTNLGVFQKYVPAAPLPSSTASVSGVSVPVGVLPIAGPNYSNRYNAVSTTDYSFSDRDRISGRFAYNDASIVDTTATLPAFYTTVQQAAYVGSFTEYHTFSPAVVNEFRLGYNRLSQNYPAGNFAFPGLDQFPNLTIDQLSLQLGPDLRAPRSEVQNTYQWTENLTWTRGSHTFKFGEDLRRYIAPSSFIQRSRGDYEYATLETYLFDIAPDVFGERTLGNPKYYGNQTATYSYLQDTWLSRPNLTVNWGLRYEYTSEPLSAGTQTLNSIANVPGLITFNSPAAQRTAFAPRAGLVYSPGHEGNTSIRAGFGLAYDVLYDNIAVVSLPPELTVTADITDPQFAGLVGAPGFLANGGFKSSLHVDRQLTPEQARQNTSAYLPAGTVPYSVQWNSGVQHVFRRDYTLEVRYLGNQSLHLPMQQQINKASPVTAAQNIPTLLAPPSAAILASLPLTVGQLSARGNVLPQYAAAGFGSVITAWTPQGWSTYNGLAVQFTRRFVRGLQLQGSYTWSHVIDNSTTDVAATYLTPRRAQDFQNLTPDKASSLLDRRQRLTWTALYDVPLHKNDRNWFMKNVIGNWEIAPIYTYETPEYYTVGSGIDSNLNGDAVGDRTIVNPAGAPGQGSDVYGLDRNGNQIALTAPPSQINTVVVWVAKNPEARYIRAGYGAFANAGRNTEAMLPIHNLDLTILKRVSFTERLRLQLLAEALNILNHPQYIAGTADAAQLPNNYSIYTPGVKTFTTASSPLFNNSRAAFSSNPRTIIIVAKFTW